MESGDVRLSRDDWVVHAHRTGPGGSLRQRRSRHDPGRTLRDLAVMVADGGDCLADLSALRDQPALFGEVASDATA